MRGRPRRRTDRTDAEESTVSWLRVSAAVAVGVPLLLLLGSNAAPNTTAVAGFTLLVAVLPLVNSSPATWIGLTITVAWTSRLLTVAGSAPRFLDFLDFPLVLIAFLLAGVRYLESSRRLPLLHRKITVRLAIVSVVIFLSWAFNDLDEPQRLIAGWVLAVEPFLLLTAILLAPLTSRQHSRLLVLVTVLLCGQSLFSLIEILQGAVSDDVKGSLLATGAGHHVSAGGLLLGFFLLARMSIPKVVVAGYGAVALFIIVTADAKQVLFVAPLALLALGISGRKKKTGASLIGAGLAGVAMAGSSLYALLSYQASATAFDFLDRSTTNGTGKFAVVNALWSDIAASPAGLAFGLGPGQSVSRFSFLTTAGLLKEGSPVTLLGLRVSRGADKYNAIAFSGPFTGESSFTSAQSSALGVLGDYGLAGLIAFVALIGSLIVALLRTGNTRLTSSALAALALLIPLSVVFDWLEQPPFTLAVMLIVGLALRTPPTFADALPTASPTPVGALPPAQFSDPMPTVGS